MPEIEYEGLVVVLTDKPILEIKGIPITPILSLEVNRAITDATSTFSATISNIGGAKTSSFSINDAVQVSLPDVGGVVNLAFTGTIDTVDNSEYSKIILKGRDYASKLQDRNVVDTYSAREVSTIITNATDGLVRYFSEFGITTNNVQVTTTTLDVIKFNNKTVYECIKELADQVQYDYYVDVNKDLHFQQKGGTSSGKTLLAGTGGNILSYSFLNDIKQSYNQITVIGQNIFYKDNIDTFSGDGTTKVFTLIHVPDAPLTLVQVGGVTKTENTDFTVDYALSKMTFVVAPPSAASNVTAKYNYHKPIIAVRNDATSISLYGLHEKIYIDKNVLTTERANTIAQGYIDLYSDPKTLLKIKVRGYEMANVEIGKTVLVTISRAGLSSSVYTVIEENFSYSRSGFICDAVLATIDISLSEILKEIKRDVRELKLRDNPNTAIVAQLVNQSMTLTQTVTVKTRNLNNTWSFDVTPAGAFDSIYLYDDNGDAFA